VDRQGKGERRARAVQLELLLPAGFGKFLEIHHFI
jgi:hypothetical protein